MIPLGVHNRRRCGLDVKQFSFESSLSFISIQVLIEKETDALKILEGLGYLALLPGWTGETPISRNELAYVF